MRNRHSMVMAVQLSAQIIAPIIALGLVVASCGSTSSTSIEQSWRAPEAQPGELQNVVALYVAEDGATRRSAEDQLARQLTASGVRAVPAYTILDGEDVHDRSRALAKLRDAGFDGVVTMRIASKDEQLEYMPDTFDAYWDMAWPGVYGDEVVPEEVVRIETNAYSLTQGKLLWSATSKSVDPGSVPGMIGEVSRMVASELTKQGLIG